LQLLASGLLQDKRLRSGWAAVRRLLAAGSGSAANKMAARLLASHFGHFCGAIEQFRLCFASCRRLMMMALAAEELPVKHQEAQEWAAFLILCFAGVLLLAAVLVLAPLRPPHLVYGT